MAEDKGMEPVKVGNALLFGEYGKFQVAPTFLERLAELTPTQRRLALARACTLPWQDNPSEMPDCFKRELETASWEAREEDRPREREPVAVETLVGSTDPPINEIFLRQIVTSSPTRRRARLAAVCAAPWLVKRKPPPEWISRDYEHAMADATEEYRLLSDRTQVD